MIGVACRLNWPGDRRELVTGDAPVTWCLEWSGDWSGLMIGVTW